jgi:hypothetical protein
VRSFAGAGVPRSLLFLLLLALVGLRAAAVVVVVVVARCFAAGAGVPRSLLLLLVLVLLVEVRGAAGGTETPCCASQARQPPLRSETYCSPRFGAQSEQLQKLRQAGHTNAFAETSNVNWGYLRSRESVTVIRECKYVRACVPILNAAIAE